MKTTRLLVLEDEALFSELLTTSLSAERGIEVVGVAQDGETALGLARDTQPDALVVDIELEGDMDGIEAAVKIKEERPEVGVVILSSHKDRRYVTSLPLEKSSGWAYLLKQSTPDVGTLVRAIQGSIMGMIVLDPAVVSSLQPRQGSPADKLTPRQRQVLELIAQGYNNAAIAQQLVLTGKSVETYINAIYQTLHLSNEPDIHARVRATLIYPESTEGRPWGQPLKKPAGAPLNLG